MSKKKDIGLALGGGCELVMGCDLRIASTTAKFGQPEIKAGIIPGGGGTQRLPRLIGITRAKKLLFTGDIIDAEEAYQTGLVNSVVSVESMIQEAKKLSWLLAERPPLALKALKQCVNVGMQMDLNSAFAYEARCLEMLLGTEDAKEGIRAFKEKRQPKFTGR